MLNKTKLLLSLILFLTAFTLSISRVEAASYSLNPSSRDVNSGDEFQVTFSLDPESKKVSSAQATAYFPSNLLEVRSVSFTTLFPSNDKNWDNSNGKLQLGSSEVSGGTYVDWRADWATVTFFAKGSGTATLRFGCPTGSAIYELGTINNLLACTSLPQGSYNISISSTPTPTSTQTPTPTPTTTCSISAPAAPAALTASTGSNTGEVILKWTRPAGATNYHVIFGDSSGNYQYGATNIGNVSSYTVKSLSPGKLYYFRVSAVNNCASSAFSNEASARAKGAGLSSGGTQVIKLTPTPAVSIYKPIGEVLPEAVQPTIAQEVTATSATTSIEEADEGSKNTPIYIWILAGLAGLVLLLIIILLLAGRSKKDDSSGGDTPTPTGSGTGPVDEQGIISQSGTIRQDEEV